MSLRGIEYQQQLRFLVATPSRAKLSGDMSSKGGTCAVKGVAPSAPAITGDHGK